MTDVAERPVITMRRILWIGCLAGLAAGAAAALFAATAGRGPINDAIAAEDGHSHAASGTHHEELFSRGVQEIGGALGLILFGLALGIVFVMVLTSVGPRLAVSTPMGASARVALVGFVTVVLVPFLKYPANPPAVGDPDTVNERTLTYLACLALSILLTLGVWAFGRRVEMAATARAWAAAALYTAGLALILVALPANSDPIELSADLVWRFRLASLGSLAAAWTVLALVTGTLLSRSPS